jgi:alpha-glucosidase (family GH31 glycosyl hydrolase)
MVKWPSVQETLIHSLNARYSIVFVYYTLFYNAHINGGTVMNSLMFNFPEDDNVTAIETQFMIGDVLLISPCLDVTQTVVTAYFPDATWYDFWTGAPKNFAQSYQTLPAPWDTVPAHVKGGSIIPKKKPETTISKTVQNPFEILIALNSDGTASGDLYVDNGDDLDVETQSSYYQFTVDNQALSTTAVRSGYSGAEVNENVSRVTVWGIKSAPSSISVGGVSVSSQYVSYSSSTQVLTVDMSNRQILVSDLTLSWY